MQGGEYNGQNMVKDWNEEKKKNEDEIAARNTILKYHDSDQQAC